MLTMLIEAGREYWLLVETSRNEMVKSVHGAYMQGAARFDHGNCLFRSQQTDGEISERLKTRHSEAERS